VDAAAPQHLRDLLRNREVGGLLAAQVTSEGGDYFIQVAVAALALSRTHSVLLAALTFALSFAPALFGGALLTPFADRVPRKRVLLYCDAARAVVVAILAVVALFQLSLLLVFALLLLAALFSVPFTAARSALLPDILPVQSEYLLVAGVSRTLNQANQVLGLTVGGLVAVLTTPATAFVVDAITFAVSFVLIAVCLSPRRAPLPAPGDRGLLRDGVRLIFLDPVLRLLVLFGWGAPLLLVAPESVALAYAHAHHVDSVGGLLMAAIPAGAALGSLAVTRQPPAVAMSRMRPAALLSAVPLLATTVNPSPLITGLLWLAAGVAQGFFMPVLFMTVNLVTPASYRGRVQGVAAGGFSVATAATYAVVGALADALSPTLAVGICGLIGLLLVGITTARWPASGIPERAARGDTTPTAAGQPTGSASTS
jgi:MFS family permease